MRKNVPILTDSVRINSFVEKLNRCATIEIIDELTGFQYSRNSLLGIYSDWNRYHAFCTKHRINTLPASITAVRRFLETESNDRKYASLKRYTATLSMLHTVLNFANPIKHRQVRFTLLHLQSQMAGDAKQTNAMTSKHLTDLNVLLSDDKANLKEIRDIAIYNVMFECALKRSELKALSMTDVEYVEDHYQVTVKGSAYQLSQIASVALQRWLSFTGTQDELPVFRAIDKHENIGLQPLDDSSIYRILRRASDLLQLPENHYFSGNSIRVGAAQELSKQGLKVREIQDFGRWLSPAMPAQYVGFSGTAESEKMKFKALTPWQ
ncbi:tyrosine-type recombinase/integrase [Vibrio satsumensis]|uniref:tyrosine-type recombinase/integrase n=1 Tax=Vibrio TaxID=662 RepID=UPI0011B46362|nr:MULTISPECIES: tyrosine-type recombinase/integrase [Vibrio]MDL5028822.1 tyrosine-type recombinase/integrase [Vibrio sp. TMPB1044]MDN5208950.1 tyrosine-type recombinase/integrase [Vibrio sp. TMPB1044]MEC7308419.1 tyrosine-type recombinase/integrase [Vibrio crassostreae]